LPHHDHCSDLDFPSPLQYTFPPIRQLTRKNTGTRSGLWFFVRFSRFFSFLASQAFYFGFLPHHVSRFDVNDRLEDLFFPFSPMIVDPFLSYADVVNPYAARTSPADRRRSVGESSSRVNNRFFNFTLFYIFFPSSFSIPPHPCQVLPHLCVLSFSVPPCPSFLSFFPFPRSLSPLCLQLSVN
jgi:hypothetical protein